MKRKALCMLCAAMMAVAAGCGSDEPEAPKDPNEGNTEEPGGNQSGGGVTDDGPIVLAYAPYYTNKMPLAANVTHINYAFAELYVNNGVYTGFKIQGNEAKFQQVLDLKKRNPDIKILLSFTNSVENSDNHIDGGFSALSANETYRKRFAKECVTFMQRWGLDGIDIDWEFPGIGWSGATVDEARDIFNYTQLMKDMRAEFGNRYLLTFAGYCMDKAKTGKGWRYIDLAAVEPYVDYVFVMTYDFDAAPHFQSAMSSAKSYWDIKRTVAAYETAGFPMEKIVMGIPFYARHSFSGGAASAPGYGKLQNLGPGYVIDNWDDEAQTPYITYNGEFWGSYDNERSIDIKAAYAAQLGMKGLFYWSVYDDDDGYTLSKATWRAVKAHYSLFTIH